MHHVLVATIITVPTLTAAQVAGLVKQAGFPESVHVTMVAIARAESGFRVEAVNNANSNGSSDYGLFQINSVHQYDSRRLTSDAAYNTQCAKSIYDSQGLRAWSVYNNGAYQQYVNEARQGVAQASGVTGSPVLPGSGSATDTQEKQQGVTYGPPGPEFTEAGVGTPLKAAEEVGGPLVGLKILGSQIGGDFASTVVGTPTFEAGIEMVPHLNFSVADPDGDLLFQVGNVWQQGNRVQYQDLDMRLDEITFTPGGHTTGQLDMTSIDDIVFALMSLTGPRSASGISASQWIAQELQLCGIDPDKYLLAESVPSQSEIIRDVPDQAGEAGSGQKPSAWTTIVRLGKELGKRVFVSGRRLVFGSSKFAMQWTAPGPLRLSYGSLDPGEQFITLPTRRGVSIGDRSNVTEVTGRVPLNRAKYFRPGVPVIIRNVASIAAGEWRQFMVASVSYTLGTDTDGADITLLEPIDPPPQPPTSTSTGANNGSTSSGAGTSGGGADGQVDSFVALCLQQAGKSYVFGAEASPSEPNPRAFDCSELVEWACARVGISPTFPDGTDAQESHCRNSGTIISVASAIGIKGALLFQPGHVAVSLGDGSTIEAMNPSRGVTKGNANNRGWTAGARIPGAKGYR